MSYKLEQNITSLEKEETLSLNASLISGALLKQIYDMQKMVVQTIENMDNGSESVDLANSLIDDVWLGSAIVHTKIDCQIEKIRVALSELDKDLVRLENKVDEKMSIQLSSQKL